jgi:DNA-binding MarR family transcriptional regulator
LRFCRHEIAAPGKIGVEQSGMEDFDVAPKRVTGKKQKPAAGRRAAKLDAEFTAPAVPETGAARDLRIGFLLHDASRMRRNAFDHFMKPMGITRSQWWVIAHLSRKDGMVQTELASLLDIGKVTLGGLLDRLGQGGWVERRQDQDDRRARRVFLTTQSHELLQKMRSVERMLNRGVLRGLSHDERDRLAALLARVKLNLVAALSEHADAQG